MVLYKKPTRASRDGIKVGSTRVRTSEDITNYLKRWPSEGSDIGMSLPHLIRAGLFQSYHVDIMLKNGPRGGVEHLLWDVERLHRAGLITREQVSKAALIDPVATLEMYPAIHNAGLHSAIDPREFSASIEHNTNEVAKSLLWAFRGKSINRFHILTVARLAPGIVLPMLPILHEYNLADRLTPATITQALKTDPESVHRNLSYVREAGLLTPAHEKTLRELGFKI